MKHNPKLVNFDRSAAYVHHRALKNMRDNNPVDALELMRHAVEHSPQNREYKLDLAEMYCEMGCHEQSNRILLDMIAQKDAPAECYYGLALNHFGRNEWESARRALMLYRRYAADGEYIDDAGDLGAEMDYYDSMRRPLNRKKGRAAQIVARACEALKADDPGKACRLFERSFAIDGDQVDMRALYAMALLMSGREEAALEQARQTVSRSNCGIRALCISGQVLWNCGLKEQGCALMRRALERRPEGVELRLLIFALGEVGMHREAADQIKRALWEAPYDKALLHMRGVALYRAGYSEDQVKSFWLRILRIDPEDSIAGYYYAAASEGRLKEANPGYGYEVPADEYRRRLMILAESLGEGIEASVERWKTDVEFRRLVIWAVSTGDEGCGRAAVMLIASVADAQSESILREVMLRGDIPLSVKLHAMLYLRGRGADLEKFMPAGISMQDGMLPEPEELLRNMPASERQMVRFAGEIIEAEFGVRAHSALALMWQAYQNACAEDNDPLLCTQEAAAALAWNYLLGNQIPVTVEKLAALFGCRPRRMVFYARRMAAMLEIHGGLNDDENH